MGKILTASYTPIKVFTPVSTWNDAPIGTLGFVHGDSWLSKAIEDEEPVLPNTPVDFKPSHVFIKFDPLHVVEAMLDKDVNSVAAIDSAAPYVVPLVKGYVKLLVPPGNSQTWHDALIWLINTYGNKPYGLSSLLGFLSEKWHHLTTNPLGTTSCVCSQAAWLYLNKGVELLNKKGFATQVLKAVLGAVTEANSAPLNLYQACSKATYHI